MRASAQRYLTPRAKGVLGYALHVYQAEINNAHGHAFLDLSQSADRCRFRADHLPCLTPHMMLWLVSKQRPLYGYEALHLQGFTLQTLRKARGLLSNSRMQYLVGNAFNAGTFFQVLLSALAA